MAASSSPPPPLSPLQEAGNHPASLSPSDPSSPKSPPPVPSATSSPPKKTQPVPWSHQETVNLIQAYQEKWYSLKKGQLKANQWEEVAVNVAARCGYDEPSKSATQCRHKIEKLRKRYRSEKLKPYPNSWPFFVLMDRMERGPLPIYAARPLAAAEFHNSNGNSMDDYGSDEDDEDDVNYSNNESKRNKSKSINHIVRGGGTDAVIANKKSRIGDTGSGGSDRVLRKKPVIHKRMECYDSHDDYEEEEDEEVEKQEEERGEVGMGSGGRSRRELAGDLATEIRAFAERFIRMENKKIEMMRDAEMYRREMEKKRMDLILDSQRKIVDMVNRTFGSHSQNKTEVVPEF